jgi:hypothetical protein
MQIKFAFLAFYCKFVALVVVGQQTKDFSTNQYTPSFGRLPPTN